MENTGQSQKATVLEQQRTTYEWYVNGELVAITHDINSPKLHLDHNDEVQCKVVNYPLGEKA